MSKIKSALTILGAVLASGATVVTTNQVVEQYNYNNIHEITTTDTYMINGEEVSKDEFDEAKNGIVNESILENEAEANIYTYSGITYSDSDCYEKAIHTEGTTFEWLAVENASDSTAGGCWDSYVLPTTSGGYRKEGTYKDNVDYCHHYVNLSCISRSTSEERNYMDYKTNCTNRTSPGIFNNKGGWSKHSSAIMGQYFLSNAKVEIINKCTTTYGGQPLYQIIISYDWAYTANELMCHLTSEE